MDQKEGRALKNWCFLTVVLRRRLLSVSWTARSNQSILKEINSEYSLEGLMLELKLQYFGHLMQRADSLKKTLMLGMIEGRRIWGLQNMRWLDGITDSMDMSLSKLGNSEGQGRLACYSAWSCKESDTPEWLNNNNMLFYLLQYKRGKMRVSKYFRDWRVSGMQVLAFATVTFCYKVLAVIFSWQAFFSFHHSEVSVCSLHLYF